MITRRRRPSGGAPRERGARPRPGAPPRVLERGAYWLLYVVAFAAAVLHWRAGNEEFAALCALAVAVSVSFIMSAHRRGGAPG
ncbi:hypothetical protein [Nocardiopsis trehalosi]|uniref:hypothetical protein n=1 Tax=Nocardiopsis trehalosi TaxID=109329 RepID=UPI00082A48E5|nr:hypothetical protein [Nocardiopsis trehalosi]